MTATDRSAKRVARLGAAIKMVRQMIDGDFPGIWPLVDAGLSTCATLLLQDNANPAAIIYVGPSSGSKTTVVELFADHDLTYVSDTFTPAAFVSQASNVSAEQARENRPATTDSAQSAHHPGACTDVSRQGRRAA